MATMQRPPSLGAEQCRMVHDLCDQRDPVIHRYMELFNHLAHRNAGPWDGFLRGASSLTLYPIHASSVTSGFSTGAEATREDWEAVGVDMWRAILALTSEQPDERSASESPGQPVRQTTR